MSIGRKKFNMDPKKGTKIILLIIKWKCLSKLQLKTGIEYLCENHLLRMDALDVALFLYKGEGLNKTAIGMVRDITIQKCVNGSKLCSNSNLFSFTGDYLGEKNDFNEQVLKAFVELHDFTNLILVQALR